MTALELVPAAPPQSAAAVRLRAEVRDFLAQEISESRFVPTPDSWLSGVDPGFSSRLGERGWIGMTWPRDYGGGGRSASERMVVIEELLAAGAPVAAHWVADRQSGANIVAFGSEEMKAEILPRIASGQCFFAIGMSEPDSGSDLASIRTRARKRADGSWTLSGTKIWTSNAQNCHYAIVLARTADRPYERDHTGMSQFVVDLRTAGVAIQPIEILDGSHHLCEVVFDDVVLPATALLGTEGSGWQQVTAELALERSGPERFLSTFVLLREFAQHAERTGDPNQLSALARLTARLVALRELSRGIAGAFDRGERVDVAAALVKDLGTTFEADTVDEIVSVTGVRPIVDSTDPLARTLAIAQLHAPAFTLRGGTNEILRSIVARGLGIRR
jgi:alkylation response protein AidB-like acyl-CoA dehydrogenase